MISTRRQMNTGSQFGRREISIRAPTWLCVALFDSKAVGQRAQTARLLRIGKPRARLFAHTTSSSTPMKRTRRQNKQAAAAVVEADAAESSQTHEASPAPTQPGFVVAIPDDLDTELLANLLPEVNLDAPSQADVVALYRLLVAQASESDALQVELEETKAEVERKDVELDQALQDKETGTKELEATLENVQNELKQAKQERDEIGAWFAHMCCTIVLIRVWRLFSFCSECPSSSTGVAEHESISIQYGGRHSQASC